MANPEPQKILEIGGKTWMEGLSLQPTMAVDGLFRQASNFDPFKVHGVYQPALGPTQYGSSTVTVVGYYNVSFETGSNSYFYSFGDSGRVYEVNTLTDIGDVNNVSAQVGGMGKIRGATKYKNKIIYANRTQVFAGAIPLALASQTPLFSTELLTDATADWVGEHVMTVGPDRNLYVANKNHVGRITNVTGTTNNVTQYLTFEDDVRVRYLESDGKYLVILADTAVSITSPTNNRTRCFVAFWNMKSQDLTQVWEFEDIIVYGMKFTGEDIIVFGRDNIYRCTVDSPLRTLIGLRGTAVLANEQATIYPGGIIRRNNSVYWGMGGEIWAYGRPSNSFKKILYQPFSLSSGNVVSLAVSGDLEWAMSDGPALFGFSTTDAATSIVTVADVDFKKPYKFAFAKVILKDPLVSGEGVALQINTQGGSKVVLNSNDMTFANDGAISSKLLYPEATPTITNTAALFEDLTSIQITNTNGAAVRRVEIWAYPAQPNQSLGY